MKVNRFEVTANNFHWIDGSLDNPEDLCLHGDVTVLIGGESLSYECCVSASAIQMLKSLTENHKITKTGEQMLPCCGHFMIPNETLDSVNNMGCINGIDYSVKRNKKNIVIKTENENEYIVPMDDYTSEVLKFAHLVEEYYKNSTPKVLPHDEWERNGYLAFWREWERRINMA